MKFCEKSFQGVVKGRERGCTRKQNPQERDTECHDTERRLAMMSGIPRERTHAHREPWRVVSVPHGSEVQTPDSQMVWFHEWKKTWPLVRVPFCLPLLSSVVPCNDWPHNCAKEPTSPEEEFRTEAEVGINDTITNRFTNTRASFDQGRKALVYVGIPGMSKAAFLHCGIEPWYGNYFTFTWSIQPCSVISKICLVQLTLVWFSHSLFSLWNLWIEFLKAPSRSWEDSSPSAGGYKDSTTTAVPIFIVSLPRFPTGM